MYQGEMQAPSLGTKKWDDTVNHTFNPRLFHGSEDVILGTFKLIFWKKVDTKLAGLF